MLSSYIFVAGLLVVWAHGGLLLAALRRRNDLADVLWGLGFIVIAWSTQWFAGMATARGLLVAALVTAWGARLVLHIHFRNRGRSEDSRYRKWREEWTAQGVFWIRTYFQVFLVQSLLLGIVASPLIWIVSSVESPWGLWDALGVTVWGVGFFFEVVGDEQLRRFLRVRQPGQFLQTGLWRYTRHPNYFGEVTLWWGLWLIACATPGGWMTVIGPLTLSGLILKVSGVPMLEAQYEGRPGWAEYRRRTSAFFPWVPRRD